MALEERLELDIAEALRGVDNIEDALTAATQAFKVGIAEALDLLSTVAIAEVDASGITTSIDAAVEAADLEPEIIAETDSITSAIDEAVSAADLEAEIHANADEVTSSIEASIGQANNVVDLEAETSAIPDAIAEALAVTEASVEVDAITTGITEQIEAAISGADVSIDVEAETAAAQEEIAQLGGVAQDTGEKLSGAGAGAEAFGALSAASAGSVGGLTGQLGKLGAVGGIAAAGVTGVALSVGALFQAALDADTADRRFAESLGEIAEQVGGIGIDGFADDLATLAEKTGNSDEALKLAVARIADLGNSAGASQDEIAGAAENIALLATRAAVLNPTLGDAGAIAESLTTALARGGRPLAQFGLSLSASAIAAEAAARGLGDDVNALSIFERAAIGADLVAAQLGGTLQTDIVEGAKGTEIQLRSLREAFGNALETFGQPLLAPVLEAIREGQPILLDLAETFGDLGATVLPVAIDLLKAMAPVISTVADVVQVFLSVLQPVVSVIDAIPDPVLKGVTAFLLLQRGISALVGVVGLVAPALAASLGPLGLVVAGVGTAIAVFSAFDSGQKATSQSVKDLTAAFADQAEAIDADIAAAVRKRVADKNQEDDLRRVGLTIREFADLSAQGAAGLNAFTDRLAETGEISPQLAAALQGAGGDIDELTRVMARASLGAGDLGKSNTGLVQSFLDEAAAAQESAQVRLTQLVNDEKLTEARVRQAEATTKNADGTKNYVAALASLEGVTADVADSTDGATSSTVAFGVSLQGELDAIDAANGALNDLVDAQIGYLDSNFAAQDANRKFGESLADVTNKANELANAVGENGRNSDEARSAQEAYNEAVRQAGEAALAAAKGELRRADDLAKANEQTLTGAQRQDIFRGSLERAAAQASGPARQAILDLIATYNAIPKEAQTRVTADITQAESELAKLRASLLNLKAVLRPTGFFDNPRIPGAMAGGTFGPGLLTVGEAGRELINIQPNTSATVIPNAQTEALLAGRGGVALDPELTAAIRTLAAQPRFAVDLGVIAAPGADPYPAAMEAARQLQALSVRMSAQT